MSSYYGSRSSFRSRKMQDDVDPMTSMSGIGDVMLVFACGLMTALVVAWSIDLGGIAEVDLGEEIEDVEEMQEELQSGGSGYVEMGTVYQDPTTGRYYLVQEEAPAGEYYDTESDLIDETAGTADLLDEAGADSTTEADTAAEPDIATEADTEAGADAAGETGTETADEGA